MFDMSWQELFLIAVVALLVIPPKDLPRALMAAGKWARRARALMRDFQHSLDELVRETELAELRRDAEAAARKVSAPLAIDQIAAEPPKKIEPPPSLAPAPMDQTHE